MKKNGCKEFVETMSQSTVPIISSRKTVEEVFEYAYRFNGRERMVALTVAGMMLNTLSGIAKNVLEAGA